MSLDDDDNFDPQFNGILHLEDQDFDQEGTLNLPEQYRGKPAMVMVFATWCGPCRSTKPQYSELFNENGHDDVVIACINGSGKSTLESEQKLMKRIKDIIPDFRGFPHIAIFDEDGKYVAAHEGPRTKESMMGSFENYRSKKINKVVSVRDKMKKQQQRK